MKLTEEEQRIKSEAERFARKNKKQIARRLTHLGICRPVEDPVSVFMAGSPGAGKTEASAAAPGAGEKQVRRVSSGALRQSILKSAFTGKSRYP